MNSFMGGKRKKKRENNNSSAQFLETKITTRFVRTIYYVVIFSEEFISSADIYHVILSLMLDINGLFVGEFAFIETVLWAKKMQKGNDSRRETHKDLHQGFLQQTLHPRKSA
jgi:hypothetical protein